VLQAVWWVDLDIQIASERIWHVTDMDENFISPIEWIDDINAIDLVLLLIASLLLSLVVK
jgi:hypothetical protein